MLLKCISSTSSKNGGFVVKLQNKDIIELDTPFGKKTQAAQTTFYVKMDNDVAIGTEGDLDLSKFQVIENPYEIPGTPEVIAQEAVYGPNPAQPNPELPNHMVLVTPAVIGVPAIKPVIVYLKWLSLKAY